MSSTQPLQQMPNNSILCHLQGCQVLCVIYPSRCQAAPEGEVRAEQGGEELEAGKHDALASTVVKFHGQGLVPSIAGGEVQPEVCPAAGLQDSSGSVGEGEGCEGPIAEPASKTCRGMHCLRAYSASMF